MRAAAQAERPVFVMSVQDLLAGASLVHETVIPARVLRPGADPDLTAAGSVRLRPLSVGVLALVSRAARDDAALVPLLMIKEAMVEPVVTLDQVRQMHIGLVHFLIGRINEISGLSSDGEALDQAADSPVGRTHVLLAKHFGWTPDQVAQLTPAQVAVYLAGVEKLLALERREGSGGA
jgi:hypothetical protein